MTNASLQFSLKTSHESSSQVSKLTLHQVKIYTPSNAGAEACLLSTSSNQVPYFASTSVSRSVSLAPNRAPLSSIPKLSRLPYALVCTGSGIGFSKYEVSLIQDPLSLEVRLCVLFSSERSCAVQQFIFQHAHNIDTSFPMVSLYGIP